MTITSARKSLTAIFLAGLVVQAAIFFDLVRLHALSPREGWPLLKTLALVYSVPLTVIIGGVFAPQEAPRSRPGSFTFWFAFGVSVIWNLLLVVPVILYFYNPNGMPADVEVALKNNSSSYNFLVAGALTYFFASHTQPAQSEAHD
jgi:hypothetical protein